jgi:hypothetical protein
MKRNKQITSKQTETEKQKTLQYFTTKPNLPFLKNMLDNPDYFKNEKGLQARLLWMSPEHYLDECLKHQGSYQQMIFDGSQEYFNQHTAKGEKLNPLMLEYANEWGKTFNQEVRNRAVWAINKGLKLVPVYVIKSSLQSQLSGKNDIKLESITKQESENFKKVLELIYQNMFPKSPYTFIIDYVFKVEGIDLGQLKLKFAKWILENQEIAKKAFPAKKKIDFETVKQVLDKFPKGKIPKPKTKNTLEYVLKVLSKIVSPESHRNPLNLVHINAGLNEIAATDASKLIIVPYKVKGETRNIDPNTGLESNDKYVGYKAIMPDISGKKYVEIELLPLLENLKGIVEFEKKYIDDPYSGTSKTNILIQSTENKNDLLFYQPSVLYDALNAMYQLGETKAKFYVEKKSEKGLLSIIGENNIQAIVMNLLVDESEFDGNGERIFVPLFDTQNKAVIPNDYIKPPAPEHDAPDSQSSNNAAAAVSETVEKEAWEMSKDDFKKATLIYNYKSSYGLKYQEFAVGLKNNEQFKYFYNEIKGLTNLSQHKERNRYVDYLKEYGLYYYNLSGKSFETVKDAMEKTRKYIIQQALSDGKPVPEEVLKDYPELQSKTQQTSKHQPATEHDATDSQSSNSTPEIKQIEEDLISGKLSSYEYAEKYNKKYGHYNESEEFVNNFPNFIKHKKSDKNIGREWDSVNGKMRITDIQIHVTGDMYSAEIIGKGNKVVNIRTNEIEKRIKKYEYELTSEYAKDNEKRIAASEKHKIEQAATELRKQNDIRELDAFLHGKTAMQKGRLIKAMLKLYNFDGKVETLKWHIEDMINNKKYYVDSSSGQRRMMLPDNSFYDEKTMKQTGMDYAEYLQSKTQDPNFPFDISKIPVHLREQAKKELDAIKSLLDKIENYTQRFSSLHYNTSQMYEADKRARDLFNELNYAIKINEIIDVRLTYTGSQSLNSYLSNISEKLDEAIEKNYDANHKNDTGSDSKAGNKQQATSQANYDTIGLTNEQINSFVQKLKLKYAKGEKLTKSTIKAFANTEFPENTPNERVLRELTELAQVIIAEDIFHSTKNESVINVLQHLEEFYKTMPVFDYRDSNTSIMQQFSTPIYIAYVMAQYCLQGKNKDTVSVFEPSAGNGLLVSYFDPKQITANELDKTRAEILQWQNFKTVLTQDAAKPFAGHEKKYDIVMTNPPFYHQNDDSKGVYYGGFKISTLDQLCSCRALDTMKDDGRAAFIIDGTPGSKLYPHHYWNDNGELISPYRNFMKYIYAYYNVEDVIHLNGHKLYSRQGQATNLRIVLINGRKSEPDIDNLPPKYNPETDILIDSITELHNRVMNPVNRQRKAKRSDEAEIIGKMQTAFYSGNIAEYEAYKDLLETQYNYKITVKNSKFDMRKGKSVKTATSQLINLEVKYLKS